MLGLGGRTYVVTGGANGIGRATAEALLQRGANVVVLDIAQSDPLDASLPGRAFHVAMDLRSEASIVAACGQVRRDVTELDGLANIAAEPVFVTRTPRFADWGVTFTASVEAYGVIIEALLPAMRRHRSSIVNMASLSAYVAQPGYGTYAAA